MRRLRGVRIWLVSGIRRRWPHRRRRLSILDVHMTGISGLDLLEWMHGRGDRVPVILITGRLDTATRSRAQAAGALAVVEKPYKAGEILPLVRRALGQAPRRPPSLQ